MKHITELKRPSAQAYARRAISLLRQRKAHYRAMDDCFEMGNGKEVVREIVKMYDSDEAVKALIDSDYGRHYINMEDWRSPYYQEA